MLPLLRFSFLLALCLAPLVIAAQPTSSAPRLPPGKGFRGAYFRGGNFEKLVLTRFDATLDFEWGEDAPVAGVAADTFSVRWTTYVQAPASGTYQLAAHYEGGMRVWIGGRPLTDDWPLGPLRTMQARVRLEAGRVYDVRVDYHRAGGENGRVALTWQPPGTARLRPFPTAGLHPMLPLEVEPTILPAADLVITAAPAPVKITAPPPASPPDRPAPTLAALGSLARGTSVALQNLYFEQGKVRLLPASGPTVDELAAALRTNPAVKLEIGGHTDNVGDSTRNQRLSEQRARHIRGLLITRGIDSVRLSAVGYGSRRPLADNRDPAQRPRNRRVEITVR